MGAQLKDIPQLLPEDGQGRRAVVMRQGIILPGDEPDERGLTGAVGAQDGGVLALANLQRQAVQDALAALDDAGGLQVQQRRPG